MNGGNSANAFNKLKLKKGENIKPVAAKTNKVTSAKNPIAEHV